MAAARKTAGVLEYVAGANGERVTRYQTQAAQLRRLAETEPVGRLRSQLVHLASEYDQMADTLKLATETRSLLAKKSVR